MTDSHMTLKNPYSGHPDSKQNEDCMMIPGVCHYVTDADGRRIAVQIDIHLFEKMLAACEEFEDIQAYDEAKKQVASEIEAGNFSTLNEYLAEKDK
ncbi:MAG: hypothetical protein V2I97_15650 [Desulfococcaceae bacterium]|nr:hypothetical protein [Desulfococcaceae bacterium]